MKNLDLELDDIGTEVQMGPLIDCVFLLLIFFMVVALTKRSHRELDVAQMPAAVRAPTEQPAAERFALTIDARGGIRVVGQDARLTLPQLAEAIRAQAARDAAQTVWIETDGATTLEMVAPVLDLCKEAGLGRFQFRTPARFTIQPHMNRS